MPPDTHRPADVAPGTAGTPPGGRRIWNRVYRTAVRLRNRWAPALVARKLPAVGSLLPRLRALSRQPVIKRLNGLPIALTLDRLDTLNLSSGQPFEPAETAFFAKHIKPGETVIDVGANIGYYTVQFAHWVGPAGMVHAIEPEPTALALLRQNVEVNGCTQVRIHPLALSDRAVSATLYQSAINLGDHRLAPAAEERDTVTIQTACLDDLVTDEAVDWIKLDIQGWEAAALRGMPRTLERNPGVRIVMEYWPEGIVRAGDDPARMLEDLTRRGFACALFHRLGELEPISCDELVRRFPADRPQHANLYVSRQAAGSL